jgi:hypothetical protein
MFQERCYRSVLLSSAMMIAIISGAFTTASAQEKAEKNKPFNAKAAFARLKAMEGTWKNQGSDHQKEGHASEGKVVYRLSGGGSALFETLLPGSDHEMVSVYHLDGNDLRMTHYCAAGNQPRMKLDLTASQPDHFIFVFDGGTNFDPAKDSHIHGLTFTFAKDGKVTCDWEGYEGGKKSSTTSFVLTRAKP